LTRSNLSKARRYGLILLFGGAAFPAALQAQDFERVQPKLPATTPVPSLAAPATPQPSTDQTVLVPDLKGIVFVSSGADVSAVPPPPAALTDGVSVAGIPLLAAPDCIAQVRAYLHRPLTLADLDALRDLARKVYIAHDRPFIDISVPPQNVQTGVVQIVVMEYRIGNIDVTGNAYFSTRQIERMGGLKSGQPLTLQGLRSTLDDYNSNPFLTVSAIAKPGVTTGVTDIELQASDRRPIRLYGGYDNQGAPSLGTEEWFAGVNFGNLFGTGQLLSYQYTQSFTGRYSSHSLTDVIPINPDKRLWIFGAYATQVPGIAPGFRSQGHSGQLSMRFVRDLPRTGSIIQSLRVGLDFKTTDNNLEFYGLRLLNSKVDIVQFPLSYSATIIDRYGQTTVENLVVVSPGGITKYNRDEDLQQLVPYADSSYVYDRLSLTRTTTLPAGFSWVLRLMAQQASGNLPYSEQIGGGLGSLRGYDPNTALGSEGFLMSQDVRTPVLSAPGPLDDKLQFGVFWDRAHTRQYTRLPDQPASVTLGSVGLGAYYNAGRYFNVQFEIGNQLEAAPGQRDRDLRAVITTMIGY
jgi:hemolysin activation/secretion protein